MKKKTPVKEKAAKKLKRQSRDVEKQDKDVAKKTLPKNTGDDSKQTIKKDIFDLNELTKPLHSPEKHLGPSLAEVRKNLRGNENKEESENDPSKKEGQYSGDILCQDLDDESLDDLNASSFSDPGIKPSLVDSGIHFDAGGFLITPSDAVSLRKVVFGNMSSTFKKEWVSQGFYFSEMYKLEYGLVQLKGGTCGILAAIQALMLKYLIFHSGLEENHVFTPPPNVRNRALIKSMSQSIWQAGGGGFGQNDEAEGTASCKVAIPSMHTIPKNAISHASYRFDNITECIDIHPFSDYDQLLSFLERNIHYFTDESRGLGCILLLYSAILSRTVEKVRRDMDEPTSTLMGAHGYCTQEMVNLLTIGRACSNVFDGNITLDGSSNTENDESSVVLKGISRQSDVGLLSLFEHYDSCKVGSYLKTPRYPIWIVCSESHFTVTFSLKKNLLSEFKAQKEPFDLYYYDQLARQDEEIKLTVDPTTPVVINEKDLISPIEHCIRTKWPNAKISWNGTEPLL